MRIAGKVAGLVLFLGSASGLISCGGGSEGPPLNPVPSISAIAPASTNTGGAGFTLTVNGSGLIAASVVRWNGSDRRTTFVDSTQLTASIPASDVAVAGTAQIQVFNLAPGGGTSGAATFAINNPAPTVSTLSPSTQTAGGAAFTLMVTGSGFVSSSVMRWNGSDRTTTFISSTQLNAAIPAGDIASGGIAQVAVFSPAPGGGTSSAASFTINNPAPTISALSPGSVMAGGLSVFSLTVTGSNFVPSSVVRWNGSSRDTAFVSSTQLDTLISPSEFAEGGTIHVEVVNPAPGGGTSASLDFTIFNPVPALSSLNPAASIVDAGPFSLRVTGSGFVPTSVVQWNGSPRTTFFQNSMVLLASIPSTDLTSAGTATVVVSSPAPGGGTSAALPFAVNNPRPVVTAISPRSSQVGGSDFMLTIEGQLFVPGAVVRWNGSDRPATRVGSSLVTAAIPASDIAAPGIATIDVVNPAPGGGSSGGFDYPVNPPGTGVTERISVASDGTQSNGDSSEPSVSGDGRFVAFRSSASNLVLSDTNGLDDIFLRDTCVGAPAGCVPSTIRVSVASNGAEANFGSASPAISYDGRFVAFQSSATNLVPGDTNNVDDIFVRDTCVGAPAGCVPSTIRVSVASNGAEGDFGSSAPAINGSGRFVAFQSSATNLVPVDTNFEDDIFLRDTCAGAPAGCTPSTFPVSVNGGVAPAISGDGQVAYGSPHHGCCVVGVQVEEVLLANTCAGAPAGCTPSTEVAAVPSPAFLCDFNLCGPPYFSGFSRLSVSPVGSFVVFSASGIEDDAGNGDVGGVFFCTSASGGSCGRFIVRLDFRLEQEPAVSGDGGLIVYVSDTTASAAEILAFDFSTTLLVSVASDGAPANDASSSPSLSADGRFVAFVSRATNLVVSDSNDVADIFLARTGRP